MDDGQQPFDDSDQPTEPQPIVRPPRRHRNTLGPAASRVPPSAPRVPDRRSALPPLPPTTRHWPRQAGDARPEWPVERQGQRQDARPQSAFQRAIEAARQRQLSLGCGALATLLLLGTLVLAALTGGFSGFGGSPLVPQPTIQAAPRPTVTPLPSPTATRTPTPTPTPSPTPLPTPTPIPTDTPEPSPTASPVPTDTPEATPTDTPIPTDTPEAIPTELPSPSQSP